MTEADRSDTLEPAPAADPASAHQEAEITPPDPAALARELADYKDRHLRLLAEMENLRRRTAREITDSRAYGISNFARDILAVADNMERALKALDAELR